MESEPAERARNRERVLGGGGRVDVRGVGRIDGRDARRIVGAAERGDPATEDLGAPPVRLRRALGPERRGALEQPERLLEAAGARRGVGRRAEERGAQRGGLGLARESQERRGRTRGVAGGVEEGEPHLRLGHDGIRGALAEHALVSRTGRLDVAGVGGEPAGEQVETRVAGRRRGGEHRLRRVAIARGGECLGVVTARDRIL